LSNREKEMARKKKEWPKGLTREAVREVIRKFGHDGHTIWDPQGIKDCGIPDEIVKKWTHVERSNGTPKGTIFNDGKILDELEGVYGLSMLANLAYMVNADTSKCDAIGRGTLASQYTNAILEALK
jgi:hypothetical protein